MIFLQMCIKSCFPHKCFRTIFTTIKFLTFMSQWMCLEIKKNNYKFYSIFERFEMYKTTVTWRSSADWNASSHRRHLWRRRITWKARIWPSNASWFGASTPQSLQRLTSLKLWDFRCSFNLYLLLSHKPHIVHNSLLSSLTSFLELSVEWCAWICLFKWPVWWKPLPHISHTFRAFSMFPKWINCSCLLRLSSSLNLWEFDDQMCK